MSLIAFLILLGPVVFVHELGHFLAAKWAKIYVHRFALGLGTPIKALSFTRGGTEYAICWLPLGGYVKMASREEEATTSALEGGAVASSVPEGTYYEDRPVWQRMIVTVAGVTMNVLFALLIFFGLGLAQGETVVTETRVGMVDLPSLPRGAEAMRQLRPGYRVTAISGTRIDDWNAVRDAIVDAPGNDVAITVNDSLTVLLRIHSDDLDGRFQAWQALLPYLPASIGTVVPGSPADRAGLVVGDTILTVAGQPVRQFYDLAAVLRAAPGKSVLLEVTGPKGRQALTVVPDSIKDSAGAVIGQIGIRPGDLPTRHRPLALGGAARVSWDRTVDASRLIFRTLRGMLFGRVSAKSLGGPIAIGQQAGVALSAGLDVFVTYMAIISVNLAVVNLFPIPVLDGGQFLFLAAEGVRRKPLSLKVRERLMMIGLALILALMVFVFWNDIARSWPAISTWWRRMMH